MVLSFCLWDAPCITEKLHSERTGLHQTQQQTAEYQQPETRVFKINSRNTSTCNKILEHIAKET